MWFECPAPVILIELTICQIACSRSQNYANLIKYQHKVWGAVGVKYFPSKTAPNLEMIIGRRTLQNIILARKRCDPSPDFYQYHNACRVLTLLLRKIHNRFT